MSRPGTVWRVLAKVRGAEAASVVFALLDEATRAVSAFEIAPEECVSRPTLPPRY
jgi:hypothetical protein